MLDILDPVHQLKVAENVVHYQILLIKIIGSKYKTIIKFQKKN